MEKNYENKNKIKFFTVLKAVLIAYLASIILFAVLALTLYFTKLSEEIIPAAVIIISSICILLSGVFTTRKVKQLGWLHGGLIGGLYVLILFMIGMIFIPNSSKINITSLFDIALGFILGVISGMVGVNL